MPVLTHWRRAVRSECPRRYPRKLGTFRSSGYPEDEDDDRRRPPTAPHAHTPYPFSWIVNCSLTSSQLPSRIPTHKPICLVSDNLSENPTPYAYALTCSAYYTILDTQSYTILTVYLHSRTKNNIVLRDYSLRILPDQRHRSMLFGFIKQRKIIKKQFNNTKRALEVEVTFVMFEMSIRTLHWPLKSAKKILESMKVKKEAELTTNEKRVFWKQTTQKIQWKSVLISTDCWKDLASRIYNVYRLNGPIAWFHMLSLRSFLT